MPDRSNLALLLSQLAAERGWSQRQVAARSHIPKATAQKIMSGKSGLPRESTLRRLSVGLDLPLGLLQAAVAADLGVHDPSPSDDEMDLILIIEGLRELPLSRRREIGALVQAMLRSQREVP